MFDFNSQGDFDTDLLKQKNFNPFFDDSETSHLLLNSNLDPDINFFSANSELLSNCLYLTSTEFNKMPVNVLAPKIGYLFFVLFLSRGNSVVNTHGGMC